ncbi:DUF3549 family protein [Marinomonas pollencensis]|uniref:Uncharacterized protein DUF3549 n=1 Tax=Marinomonas pollencensis TaxID=491954 RepID=A0A3E0DST9_9GAMM|nr:DUF3549 family protein [Marinomonas pollencensis]REG86476.1 uncharacterized protein DUF3549 [Marinomonas pollencensis]
MKNIESLGDLFDMVGCDATFYDLGRHITKITPQQVIQFDRKQQAYPFPFRQAAWLACFLKSKDSQKQEASDTGVVWFLKLPLDEAGCLNLGTRDHFIKSIVDKILHKGEAAGLSEALEDNPYVFKPDQERMASFHAILAANLNAPTSEYFQDVVNYLSPKGQAEAQQEWQNLGLQGIAELAVRAHQAPYTDLILNAIEQAPKPLVSALCHALEHETLAPELSAAIINKLLQEEDTLMQASYLRALSRSELDDALLLPLFAMLGSVNECSDAQIHPIAALAAKCPHWLAKNSQLMRIVMEKLAHRDDAYVAFRQVSSELSQQPETRQPLWDLFRSERISPNLAQAISHLFTQTPHSVQ